VLQIAGNKREPTKRQRAKFAALTVQLRIARKRGTVHPSGREKVPKKFTHVIGGGRPGKFLEGNHITINSRLIKKMPSPESLENQTGPNSMQCQGFPEVSWKRIRNTCRCSRPRGTQSQLRNESVDVHVKFLSFSLGVDCGMRNLFQSRPVRTQGYV